MRVRFLGQEDPLEKEMTTHSSILALKILADYSTRGCKEANTTEQLRSLRMHRWSTTDSFYLYILN